MSTNSGSDSKNTLYCSFCGKSQHEVRKLIAGPRYLYVMSALNYAWILSVKKPINWF